MTSFLEMALPSPTFPLRRPSHTRLADTPTTEMRTLTTNQDAFGAGEAPSQDAGFCLELPRAHEEETGSRMPGRHGACWTPRGGNNWGAYDHSW